MTADPAVKIPANCLMRGIPGTYTRLTAETQLEAQLHRSGSARCSRRSSRCAATSPSFNIRNEPGVSNFLQPGDYAETRFMPTAGVEYRYPFINVQSWGTQTIEPIAQIIVRPNEPRIGRFPNEDSQSLIFDDSNLFDIDKYSGYDRIEGGGRANVGIQYTMQFNQGGFVNAMFGQSYQLFGINSFAAGDIANTGLGSGLETTRSDYVARLSYQPDRTYTFSTRYRFDEQTFDVRRFEAEAAANFDRWSVVALYGNYDAQPRTRLPDPPRGRARPDPDQTRSELGRHAAARAMTSTTRSSTRSSFGLGYIDDCIIIGLNYITNYAYSNTTRIDHRVMLQLSLRTLGGTQYSQTVGAMGTASDPAAAVLPPGRCPRIALSLDPPCWILPAGPPLLGRKAGSALRTG